MPVTPTFSEDFYKKLGHGIAEEFVNWFNQAHIAFRTDLKELNELNYARFESKLEQRISELRAPPEGRTRSDGGYVASGDRQPGNQAVW